MEEQSFHVEETNFVVKFCGDSEQNEDGIPTDSRGELFFVIDPLSEYPGKRGDGKPITLRTLSMEPRGSSGVGGLVLIFMTTFALKTLQPAASSRRTSSRTSCCLNACISRARAVIHSLE